MALDLKISYEGVDSSGRVLNIKDSTGVYDSVDNTGGWGGANPSPTSLTRFIVTVSPIFSKEVYREDFLASDWSLPDIAGGTTTLALSSLSLGITSSFEPLKSFYDGVYDFNYYAVFGSVGGIVASKGNNFITGPGMDIYFEYDSLFIDGELYTIDHTVPPYGNTTLKLVEVLRGSANTMNPALRANTKGIVESDSDRLLMANSAKIATSCDCGDRTLINSATDALVMKTAALMNFNSWNYAQADSLLRAATGNLKKVLEGCGC